MIHRLVQALRDQNWATIAIEFVLLVPGVFFSIGESRALMPQMRAQPSQRPALAYWMSTVSLTRPALDQQIAGARAVLVSIDSVLGD
jgi:hypothetical protein